jgi:hypothetical protein
MERESKSLARDENEQNTQSNIHDKRHSQYHESSADQELPDVRLPDTREVEGCVLAQSY